MLKSDAAAFLAGVKQVEGAAASAPTNLHVITGEVGTTSEDGKTTVSIDGLVFSEEDSQEIQIDTLGGLEEGDIATIILTGESGHGMTPLAIGGVGSVDRLKARVVETELLIADKADIEDLEAATARIGDLEADHVSVNTLEAATARIETLEVDHVSIADFEVEQANIDNLQAATADIDTIRANSAKVQNLTAAQLEADHATIGTLDTTYMHADMANADVAWIQNGTIKDGAIVSAMINDVSANKLTAGTINGSVINVTNLNADNITAGTINGQRIGTGSLSLDKLSENVYTESEVDTIVDGLNDRIDGAIETHTGTAVPTLNNQPASSWNTTALKDEHVGDVYYVVNSQSQQNGYCYRFTKSGSTYSWQLIKDSDVTAALSRLTTAEGKITSIESFDSTVSSFMTNTDSELTSVKSRATSLETRMTDAEEDISEKVDTSMFNTLSQTVDGNSASITSMGTVLTNNGLTSSTNITNTVNTVSQTASGNSSKITQLTTTLGTNADGTTKAGDVMHRTSAIEQDVSSFKTTVSETYATKTAVNGKADASDVTALAGRVTTAESNITQNANNIALKVSETDVTGNYIVGKINLDSTTASIAAQHINLQGAVTISDLASDAQNATLNSNISVGGRNLVSSLAANWRRTTVSESSSVGTSWGYMSRTASTTRISAIDLIPVDGDFVTVSLASGYDVFLTFFNANGYMKKYLTWSNQRTVDLSEYSGVTAIGLTVRKSGNSTITLDEVAAAKIKLEKGNKATDWTPAPEDVDSAISDASKTATSYVTEITGQNGIMVHPSGNQNTGVRVTSDVDILRSGTSVANYGTTARIGTLAGKHVSIDSDSVDLMDGNASLATFGANDTHIGMSGTGNVYMANDKFLLSATTTEGTWDSTEGSVTTSVPYTEVKSGFKAQNIGTNYRVYSGLNSTLGYNDDGGYTASDTFIDAWVEDSSGHELHRAYVELWADPLYQTAVRLHGDEIGLGGNSVWYQSPYNGYPLDLGKPVVRSANKSMTITSTNTWIDGPSVYLDQGQWLVVGVACFNSGSSSGSRKLRAQLRLDSSVYVEGTEVRVATNEYGRIQATAIMTVNSAEGLDATLVLSSSMTFTSATTSYVTAVQLA